MLKQKIDCLFIHTPEYIRNKNPFPMFMAMGLFALADCLRKKGYSSKILHLGVEKILNNQFSILNYLKSKEVNLIGISLHWHAQSNRCIRLVNQIKSAQPKIKIVLGGFTASFFANEIMGVFKNIDFIIRGDGEVPILILMNELRKSKPQFSLVPNLTWRDGCKIIHNNHTYVATESDINNLNFSNFKLMENFHTYLKVPITMRSYSKNMLKKCNTLFLCVGRGCSVKCSFCGGSNVSQQIINQRKKIIFRSHEKVLATIKDAIKAGVDHLYVCFDPEPDRKYYFKLFKLIRRNKIDTSMTYECWSLPSLKFIDEFKKTFGKGEYSKIVISPESGSERLRKLNKGFFYTNRELLNVLEYLNRNHISTEIYFSFRLPYENIRDGTTTYNFMALVKKKIGNSGTILIQNLRLDPASPLFIHPKEYKINIGVKTFSDYCDVVRNMDIFFFKGLARDRLNSEYVNFPNNIKKIHKLIPRIIRNSRHKFYKEAIRIANKAKGLYKDSKIPHLYFHEDSQIRLLLGLCYEKIKNYKKAIDELKKVEVIFPESTEINVNLFRCYNSIGQIGQANKELKKVYYKSKQSSNFLRFKDSEKHD